MAGKFDIKAMQEKLKKKKEELELEAARKKNPKLAKQELAKQIEKERRKLDRIQEEKRGPAKKEDALLQLQKRVKKEGLSVKQVHSELLKMDPNATTIDAMKFQRKSREGAVESLKRLKVTNISSLAKNVLTHKPKEEKTRKAMEMTARGEREAKERAYLAERVAIAKEKIKLQKEKENLKSLKREIKIKEKLGSLTQEIKEMETMLGKERSKTKSKLRRKMPEKKFAEPTRIIIKRKAKKELPKPRPKRKIPKIRPK